MQFSSLACFLCVFAPLREACFASCRGDVVRCAARAATHSAIVPDKHHATSIATKAVTSYRTPKLQVTKPAPRGGGGIDRRGAASRGGRRGPGCLWGSWLPPSALCGRDARRRSGRTGPRR